MSAEYYTRDCNGQITEFDCIEDAIKSFLSYDGYRLDIMTPDVKMFIRRNDLPNADGASVFESIKFHGLQYDARISIHRR